jgi:hypothetical protein
MKTLLCSAFVLLACTAAYAGEWVEIPAAADTYIRLLSYEFEPLEEDENFGNSENMLCKARIDYEYIEDCDVLIYFDLDEIGPGDEVLEARLSLYSLGGSGGGADDWGFRVYRIDEPWAEMAVTWANQPGTDELMGNWHELPPTGQYCDVAMLDPDIIGWMAHNPDSNYGVLYTMWFSTELNVMSCYLDASSREGGHPPLLKVLVSRTDVRESSWGEIKAAF